MTVCGHQFHGGDEADWVLSTSAGCLDGSTTATRILQELFRKHYKTTKKRTNIPNTPPKATPPTAQHPPPKPQQPHSTLIVTKIPSSSSFDQSQHLNGCPIKWLHNRRLSQRNRHPPAEHRDRLCSLNGPPKDHPRDRPPNLRDRTPVEVKVHKINLTEKYTNDPAEAHSEGPTDFHARRKNLAAKLNWKLHDDSPDDRDPDTSRHDFFPPRPLLGLKPLLSVLLAPHRTDCCCLLTPLPRAAASSLPGRKPSLTVQCLDFPLERTEDSRRPRPRTTNGLRWGSKPRTKKLQIPPQVTIKLEQKKQQQQKSVRESEVVHSSPRARRRTERGKERKSLECLFYELRGKANEEVLEEMVRELSTEGQYKVKRFLEFGGGSPGRACELGRRERQVEGSVGTSESNPACGKVRFFRKGVGKEGASANGGLEGSFG